MIKIRKNGGDESDVIVPAVLRWGAGVATAVASGLLVSAVIGNIVMYRQVGVLQEAITQQAKAIDALAIQTAHYFEESARDRAALHLGQDQLKEFQKTIYRETKRR